MSLWGYVLSSFLLSVVFKLLFSDFNQNKALMSCNKDNNCIFVDITMDKKEQIVLKDIIIDVVPVWHWLLQE